MFKNALALLAIVGFSAAGKLPKSWKTCKTDSGMNTCLENAIAGAISSMKNGMPSVGVTPLDPLHFDRLMVDQSSGPVAVKLEFKNMDIKGLTSLKIKNVESDMMKGHLKFQHYVTDNKPVVLEADYTIKGSILILPIQGKGKAKMVFDRSHMNIDMNGKVIEKKNEKYFVVENLTTEILPEHMTIHFSNLFNGNKELGDNMNKFLNENWQEIMKELGPAISRGISEGFKEISNRVFQRISLNQIVKQ